MKIMFVKILFVCCFFMNFTIVKAQNSYLPIDTACSNCIITKVMGDSTLEYHFNDSTVIQIHITYRDESKFSSYRRMDIDSLLIYYSIKIDCYCQQRLVRRKKSLPVNYTYNNCRKTRKIKYVYQNGQYSEMDSGWKKTYFFTLPLVASTSFSFKKKLYL